MRLHLAHAFSNRAPRGRKHDFKDAERLVRRLIAKELILSFVPDGEQRIWRSMTRMKLQLTRDRVRLQNQIECLLEEMRIKLSIVLSDLLGASGLRMLLALAEGETDPKKLAQLGDQRLQCTEEQLVDALTGRAQPMHREMLALQLERLQLIDTQIAKLNGMIAQAMKPHQEAVMRLAEVPGLGVDSAQQIIAEVGVQASTFPSAAELTSWVGTCPGKDESAEQNHSSRSAKGNKYLRRVLNQAAHAAVKNKGSYFQAVFRRLLPPAEVQRLSRRTFSPIGIGLLRNGGLGWPGKQNCHCRHKGHQRCCGAEVLHVGRYQEGHETPDSAQNESCGK